MLPTSDNFKKFIYTAERELLAKIEVDLVNGTHLTLNNYDLLEGGFEIEDAVSESGKFQIGAAIINQLTLILNLFGDKMRGSDLSSIDFTGATLRPYVGLVVKKDWTGDTVEWLPKGVFTAEKPAAVGSRITVTALDNMAKLDTAYSKSTLSYPATLGQIAADACSVCGVALATGTFPNSTFSVAKRPEGDSITCREILSYVAQLSGGFARCNTNGAVEIRWYAEGDKLCDVGTGQSSSTVAEIDTTITGVQIQNSDNTVYSSGTDGFTVRIQSNPLAQGNLQPVANTLGTKLNGFSFRGYTASSLSNPAIEAGDVVNMTDSKGITRNTVVSRLVYRIDGAEEYNADAETAAENQSERFTAAQKAQETADRANDGVAKANIRIGDLEITIEGKVSFSDLSSSGKTTINGDNITTGRIESNNGEFWLDLEEGTFYLSGGTYAGNLEWDNGASIIGTVGTALTIASGGGVRIQLMNNKVTISDDTMVSGGVTVGGTLEIDGGLTVDGNSPYSGRVRIQRDEGEFRDLLFKDGILVDNDA